MAYPILRRTGAILVAGGLLSTACQQEAAQTRAAELSTADTSAAAAAAVPPPPPDAEPFQTTDFRRGKAAGDKKIEGTLDAIAPDSPDLDGTYLRVRLSGLDPGPHAWHPQRSLCRHRQDHCRLHTHGFHQGIGESIVADAKRPGRHSTFVPTDMLSRQRMEKRAYSVRVHERDGPDPGQSIACARL